MIINTFKSLLSNCNSLVHCARCMSYEMRHVNVLTPVNTKIYRTSLRPKDHTTEHIGMWYTVDKDLAARIYKYEGLTLRYKDLIEPFGETSIMVREPAVSLIDYITRSDLTLPPNKFILYGKTGTGKTMTLAHTIHHLVEEGWLVVHSGIPARWSSSPTMKDIMPSTSREGMYDHATRGSLWLQQFRSQNETLLANPQLVTSSEHEWTTRDSTPKGDPLLSVVDFGIARGKYACECIYQLFEELKTLANEKRIKLAVVIDGINSLFARDTKYRDSDQNPILVEKLTLYQAFVSLLQNDWRNGVIIGSTDIKMSTKDRRDSYLPRYLLRKKGWETLDPFVPICVDKYTEKEFESALNYYVDRKWLQHPAASSVEGRDEIAFLSGYYPLEVSLLTNKY